MNYNCKYCDYVDKCSRRCEYDSILCKMNRSFPKIVKRPYKEILYENSDLKQALNEIREYIKDRMILEQAFCLDMKQCEYILQIIDEVGGNK